jgi:hypothetical protein
MRIESHKRKQFVLLVEGMQCPYRLCPALNHMGHKKMWGYLVTPDRIMPVLSGAGKAEFGFHWFLLKTPIDRLILRLRCQRIHYKESVNPVKMKNCRFRESVSQ